MRKLFCALLAICAAALTTIHAQQTNDPGFQLQKFTQFYRYLNGAYVDSVNNSQLIAVAIRDMLAQLDPHSNYLSAEDMKGEEESMEGSFSGIGVEFNVLRDTIIVVNVIVGGPAEKVGVLPNDRIVNVDGKSAVGSKQSDVPKLLRGPKGSVVVIEVSRAGENRLLDFTIVRDDIPINTIDAAYKVDASTGYIKVNRFAKNTFSEFTDAFNKMGKIDALILDLRGNGGGLLDQAILLSNFFLPRGSLIVSTEGMRVPPEQISATKNGAFITGKVVVLINETSASGSEIVAGAIQDWDRGLLIGRTSFGKGLVQRQFPLPDGSAIRLTVARYHTPSGRVIQRPYVQGEREQYYANFTERLGKEETSEATGPVYRTLRNQRAVYGGGGITPDIVMPVDTAMYSNYWDDLLRKGVINDFVVDYMAKNRSTLAGRYANVEAFLKNFHVDSTIIDALTQSATAKGIPLNREQLAISETGIKVQLKALIAQKLWGINEFYYILNAENDPAFDKALQALKNWGQYAPGITQ